MADISALGALQGNEALDLDTYKDLGSGRRQFPVAGRYTLRAPESFPAEAFGVARSGALSVQIDPTIVGPTNEGTQLRFIKISAKQYQRGGQQVSQIGDYLRAVGRRGKLVTAEDVANAIEATANMTYEAEVDWRVFSRGANKDGSDFKLESMTEFPKNADGTYQPWVNHPTAVNAETGEPLRLRANLHITRFYPAS